MHTTARQGQRAHATRRKWQNAEIEVNGAGLQGTIRILREGGKISQHERVPIECERNPVHGT